ncbi:hypothetical protein D3C73_1397360 [compost metagenome]
MDDRIFLIDIRIRRVTVLRFDDDHPIHSVGYVKQYWTYSAMVHEHAGCIGRIGKRSLLVGHHLDELLAGSGMDGVKIHRMRHIRV